MALTVDLYELRLATHWNRRRDDVAGLGVDGSQIGTAAVKRKDAARYRLIDDGVGILAGLHLAQDLQCLEIEDCHVVILAVAGEATAQVAGNGDSMHSGSARD